MRIFLSRQHRVFLLTPPLLSLIYYLAIGAMATSTDNGFPYLLGSDISITQDFGGVEVQDRQALNATDYYFVHTRFANPSNETRYFDNVFYVVLVVDQDGYAYFAEANTYGNRTVEAHGDHVYLLTWSPILPGEYKIRTFLISNFDNPQVLSNVAVSDVKVKEKIDKFGEGEGNSRVQVRSINYSNNSVQVLYDFCNETYPYSHQALAILFVGDHVSSNAVDAYFLGVEEGKAIFRFESNEKDDFCLV